MTLKHLTAENYSLEVEKATTPVIVDFYADWCGPCRMMAPVFEEVSKDYKGKVSFVKLDTENESDLAQNFEVMGIPTLLVLNKGKEVGRIVGFLPKQMLKSKIDNILSELK